MNDSPQQFILVRKFASKDDEPILKLFQEAVTSINIRHYSKEQVAIWTKVDIEKWRKTLQSNETFVAEIDGAIVGFADLRQDGLIDRMYIHRDYQGRFISLYLLRSIEDAAKKLGLKKIFTNCSITAKIPAERAGLKVIKEQQVEKEGMLFTNFLMEKAL